MYGSHDRLKNLRYSSLTRSQRVKNLPWMSGWDTSLISRVQTRSVLKDWKEEKERIFSSPFLAPGTKKMVCLIFFKNQDQFRLKEEGKKFQILGKNLVCFTTFSWMFFCENVGFSSNVGRKCTFDFLCQKDFPCFVEFFVLVRVNQSHKKNLLFF